MGLSDLTTNKKFRKIKTQQKTNNMASLVTRLANPNLVASFQKRCGVEFVDDDSADGGQFYTLQGSTLTKNVPRPPPTHGRRSAIHKAADDHEKPTANNNNNNNNEDKHSPLCNNGYTNDFRQLLHNRVNGVNIETDSFDRENISDKISGSCHAWKQGGVGCGVNGVVTHPKASGSPSVPIEGKSVTRVAIRYPVLYYWAKVGAFLGNEEFYLTGLPFVIWAVDSVVLRQMAVVWWLVMYLGQAGKDYFAWPRPPSPPVVRLETTHLAEYALPSTHAMAGTAIPLLLSKLLLERYELPTLPVMGVAFFWCFTTCLSRLYLGVHTVLDVLSGFLVSLALYFLVSPLTAGYDRYQQTHPLAPLVLILASLALCTICYPSGSGKTSAKQDAITTTSVVVGLGIGAWLNYQLGFSQLVPKPVRLPVSPPTLVWLGVSLLQFGFGVAVVFAMKLLLKRLTVSFFSFFFGLDRQDSQHPGVMVGASYVTYVCLGLIITFLNPLLFTLLGFGRPGYYLEVL